MLRAAVMQRMVRSEEDMGSNSEFEILNKLITDLRYALCEAEDILDLISYHRIEKSIISATDQSSSRSPVQPPTHQEPSSSVMQHLRGYFMRSLSSVSSWWERVRGTKHKKMDYLCLPITDRISLRERITQIENIVNDSKKSHLLNQQSSSNSSIRQEEDDHLYTMGERKVFGRDTERNDICKMLRVGADACGKPYSVIGIHGIAGSGKSTLARYVCDYEKDEGNHFDLVMFVHVSIRLRVDDIFRDMLQQMEQIPPSDIKSLQEELKIKLKGQRFLLVLDDLWVNQGIRNKQLSILLDALCAGRIGSKILVTAQKSDVAAALDAQEQLLLGPLNEEEYLTMFMHHALQSKVDHNREFERAGRMIAEKLHCSPIAAVAVASRLRTKKDIRYWETIANLDTLKETMGALWWSYDQLGVDTRRCFEYCSIFPRGYKLQRDELVRMWIAQGFVRTSNASEDLEDIGQHYIDELLTFSFFQELPRTGLSTEQIIIHDLLHELAERIAGSDFLRIDVNTSPTNIPPNVRHLFIETYERAEIRDNDLELANLRTLIIEEKFPPNLDRNPDKYDLPSITSKPVWYELANEEVFQSIFRRLRKLRLLVVEVIFSDSLVFSVPESIGHMKHLRYLGLRPTANPREIKFPSTFNKLYHMQILDCPLWELSCTENMSNLIHLRHISGYHFPNIGIHKDLPTLPSNEFIVLKEQAGYELNHLKNLNKLRGTLVIHGLKDVTSNVEALQANLVLKKRLTELSLNFSGNNVDPSVQANVLEDLCPPEHLKKLHIWNYMGTKYPNWMLSCQHRGAPKHLNELEFSACSQLVCIPNDSAFFNGLYSLKIANCHWDSLPDNIESLNSLDTLVISYCNNIKLLPDLPFSLQRIKIVGDSSVLWKSCQEKGHKNWKTIYHIRTKEFY